ncbi:MAG: hypothetical protein KY437_05945 [Actinobacteria bacterium]|nr:hypothetical protein [Actinomycetota bacterium]
MSPLLVIAAAVALLALIGLGLVVLALVRRLKQLAASVRSIQEELAPALGELNRETAVAQRELARLADTASEAREGPER